MAHIEIHALSVKLAGTFEAHVFFPEQEVELRIPCGRMLGNFPLFISSQ